MHSGILCGSLAAESERLIQSQRINSPINHALLLIKSPPTALSLVRAECTSSLSSGSLGTRENHLEAVRTSDYSLHATCL